MLILLKFLYITFLLPPGIIITALVMLSVRLYRRNFKLAKVLLLVTVLLYILSTPFVGSGLIRILESKYRAMADLHGDVIVVLGAGALDNSMNANGVGTLPGSSASRLLTSVQLYNQLNVPIILSGGKVYSSGGDEIEIQRHVLLGLGVPEEKIILDNQSLTTSLSGANVKCICDELNFSRPILVTSAFHMERAVHQFQKFGLSVTPYPTDYFANNEPSYSFEEFWPSAVALEASSLAIKEYIGISAARWY